MAATFCTLRIAIRGLRHSQQETLGLPFVCRHRTPRTSSHEALYRPSFTAARRRGRIRKCRLVALASDTGQRSNPSPEPRSSLAQLCHALELCFFEVCVHNLGRPAGLALHGFVFATVDAFFNGYTLDQISLQLVFGSEGMREFELGCAGYRLTATEEHYRSKWLETIYTTLQILKVVDNEASRSPATDDMHLYSIIYRVIEGQHWGDEQSLATFDRGLATRGASGGVVAEKVVIAPQWVPVTQLVLLTLKVVNEAS